LFLYLTEARGPVDVALGSWAPSIVFGGEALVPQPFGLLVLLYFFLPPVALTVLYLSLVGRLKDRTQRFRVVAVGIGILLFQVANSIQSNPNTSRESPIWLALIGMNIVAGLIAYYAYRPPSWMKRAFRVESLNGTPADRRDLKRPGARGGPTTKT
jgi:uncharacterized membrane protein